MHKCQGVERGIREPIECKTPPHLQAWRNRKHSGLFAPLSGGGGATSVAAGPFFLADLSSAEASWCTRISSFARDKCPNGLRAITQFGTLDEWFRLDRT